MSLKEVCILPDTDCIEYILYHIYSAQFDSLVDVFFIYLRCIQNRHQESCGTVYCLFESPRLHLLYLMLHKNWRFNTYKIKYSQRKIKEEMDKLILSHQLRKQVANISLESFEIFLHIDVNRKYCTFY